MNSSTILSYGSQVISQEARALSHLKLDENFVKAVEAIRDCSGRVVVSGIGKAGLIGAKISATMASTGVPSLELHPIEALHGDLGRLASEDILLALSNSGETEELLKLLPSVRQIGVVIISITGAFESALARHSDIVLDIGRVDEACPLGMAPSTSTTAMLAVGDALSLTVSHMKNFTREEFARYHPGGKLGLKLMKISDVMRRGENVPLVTKDTKVRDVLLTITRCRSGAGLVVDDNNKLLGIFSDGDLRRCLEADSLDDLDLPVAKVMTSDPVTIRETELATAGLHLLKTKRKNQLPVVDDGGQICGLLDVQDLLDIGLV